MPSKMIRGYYRTSGNRGADRYERMTGAKLSGPVMAVIHNSVTQLFQVQGADQS